MKRLILMLLLCLVSLNLFGEELHSLGSTAFDRANANDATKDAQDCQTWLTQNTGSTEMGSTLSTQQIADNLFNAIEWLYGQYFPMGGKTLVVGSENDVIYYRYYAENDVYLALYKMGVYYSFYGEQNYLGSIKKVDAMFCDNRCLLVIQSPIVNKCNGLVEAGGVQSEAYSIDLGKLSGNFVFEYHDVTTRNRNRNLSQWNTTVILVVLSVTIFVVIKSVATSMIQNSLSKAGTKVSYILLNSW